MFVVRFSDQGREKWRWNLILWDVKGAVEGFEENINGIK